VPTPELQGEFRDLLVWEQEARSFLAALQLRARRLVIGREKYVYWE
jgi:hypothetical protein